MGEVMTTIAWDGKTLAADRQGVQGETRILAPKLEVHDGYAYAWAGNQERGMEMRDHFVRGSAWPEYKTIGQGDNWTRLIIVNLATRECWFCETQPVKQPCIDPFMAWGSGREYAIGAMSMGANAEKAIEIASRFDVHTGMGVDVVAVHDA